MCKLCINSMYYEAKIRSKLCLVLLNESMAMAPSLVVEGHSTLKTCASLMNKWSCKGRGSHAISMTYYIHGGGFYWLVY